MLRLGQRGTEGYPSLLQDIIKGRPTEIEWLHGYVIKRGREVGVPTPTHEVLYHLVKDIEEGRLKYSPDNIDTAYQLIITECAHH